MGISTVTISIEEFEDLIENKKKVEEIKKTVDKNDTKNILPATLKMVVLFELGKIKEAEEVAHEADSKNLDTLQKINEILNKKGGAGNEKI